MNIPSLGPRGEGWVVIQFACLGLIAAGGFLAPTGIPGDAGVAAALGGILVIAGLALAGWGVLALQGARALTALPYPRDDAALVQTGAFRLARHPIYGGLVLMAFGWSELRTSFPALVASIALAVALDLKRRREEVWLVARYPGYRDYRARTKALIPFLY